MGQPSAAIISAAYASNEAPGAVAITEVTDTTTRPSLSNTSSVSLSSSCFGLFRPVSSLDSRGCSSHGALKNGGANKVDIVTPGQNKGKTP